MAVRTQRGQPVLVGDLLEVQIDADFFDTRENLRTLALVLAVQQTSVTALINLPPTLKRTESLSESHVLTLFWGVRRLVSAAQHCWTATSRKGQ